jgi:hypothetical protein
MSHCFKFIAVFHGLIISVIQLQAQLARVLVKLFYIVNLVEHVEVAMRWQQLLSNTFLRLSEEFENILDGLIFDDLHKRPAPDANTIGWLLWHTTRSLDRTVGDVMYGEQLWIKDGWHVRFNRSADPNETGYQHSFEEVGNFRVPDICTLRDYQRAFVEILVKYLESLSENGLDREYPLSTHPGTTASAGMRIIGNISDCFQHIGQAAYVRGLIKGQGWLGR